MNHIKQITLGCGCFWCFEATIQRLQGVINVTSGYAGGSLENPSYEQVCSGLTGHAEVIQIEFDEQQLPLTVLLDVFFSAHNPTTLNRQGADIGTQYRSVIFYHDTQQQQLAQAYIQTLNASSQWQQPIVTELSPLELFYAAESYHHDYYNQHPTQGYCQAVIQPKLMALQNQHPHLLKK